MAIIYEQNIHRKNLALKFNQEKDQYAKDLQAVASIEVHGDAKDYSWESTLELKHHLSNLLILLHAFAPYQEDPSFEEIV